MSLPTTTPPPSAGFSPEQKEYLEGFLAAMAARAPFVGETSGGQITANPASGAVNLAAPPAEDTVYGTPVGDLCKPERWKHDENPLDIWEKLVAHADRDRFPDEADTFRFKFHGLFYVAPAQDSFMVRLRIPACELTSTQMHGIADLAHDLGADCAHITTRGNLQIRELRPRDIVKVLTRIQDLGLTSRGSGADNVRNITASPDSGFSPVELIDVRPFAKGLHHYILNHRDLYALPRKFNVAFDNGGDISTAADTNDIGFLAVRVTEKSLVAAPAQAPAIEPGVYFRLQLGGISGHGDFARDTGLLIRPSETVAVAAAMIRVFKEHGDRTNRKKARLKYLLEKWGVEKFIAETQTKLAFTLLQAPLIACEARRPVVKQGWLGASRQAQKGMQSLGFGTQAGRMSARQMHALADLATHYGKGDLRLTVWQSVIIPHVPDAFVQTVLRSIARLGFYHEAAASAGGIVACTGNKGCKYAAADTKAHAASLMKCLGSRVKLSSPVNVHITGCPNSCAQHYCGDLGLVGSRLADGSEGYNLVLGGGMDNEHGIARELFRGLHHAEVNRTVEHILNTYETEKTSGETFVAWARRHSVKQLQEKFSS